MRIKKKHLKLIFVTMLVLIILNLISNIVFATSSEPKVVNDLSEVTAEEQQVEEDFNLFGGVIDGIVGILTYVIKVPILLILMGIQAIFTGVAMLDGHSQIDGLLTPDDLFFNRVGITNIDFFDFSVGGAVGIIRQNVATWYYIFRILSVIILLGILLYVGIRMAISTVASEQAQYKKMLTDWLVSFALIFMLNYIIIFAIEVNNGFIGLLEGPVRTKIGSGITTSLVKQSLGIMATKSWGALMVYAMLIGMTAAFLFSYVKRMLTIGFLILISPLITITYSVDKIGDGKAQALNAWLKEFLFNVLIQPFHCIIYIVFASTAVDLLSTSGSLAKMVLAIMCMAFIWKAEKIVKEIFGFKSATSLAETVASFMVVKEVGKKLANGASKAGAAAGGIALKGTKFGQNISNKVGSSKLGTKYKDWKTNNPDVARKIEQIGSAYGNALKKAAPVAIGATASAFEAGTNTPANSLDVGLQAGTIASKLINGDPTADGSKEKISAAEKNMEKAADNFARNSRFGCGNYRNDQNSKDRLKSYVQQLIGADMDTLNNNVQDALKDLMNADPTYNINTPEGMKHLNDLQDIALSQELDFHDPSTNPLGHRWTTQEMNAVSAIQLKNLATAVKGTHAQYQAAGRNNPSQDVDNFIENMK